MTFPLVRAWASIFCNIKYIIRVTRGKGNFNSIRLPFLEETRTNKISTVWSWWKHKIRLLLCFWPGGGVTLLYKPYRYVPPHQVGVLRRFGPKTGIHFAHFGLDSVYGFPGNCGVYERIYRFNFKWLRKKEKYANTKWIWRICLFAL